MEDNQKIKTAVNANLEENQLSNFSFSEFSLDCRQKRLYKNGTRVSIDKKMLKFLCLLVQRSPEAVSKEELLDTLWENQIVTEWSLSRLVSDTRKILGDDGKTQRFIQTYRGQGFCFSGALTSIDSNGSVMDSRQLNQSKKTYKNFIMGLVFTLILSLGLLLYYLHKQNLDNYKQENLVKIINNLEQNLILTKTSHEAQKRRRNELGELLKLRFNLTEPLEWEKVFSTHYSQLNATELFIFHQIRAITDGPIYEGNRNVLQILKDNPNLKEEFTSYQALINHLSFWLNKYEKIFKQRKDMCLLYTGEEDGVPFPSAIDQEVSNWLTLNTKPTK